MDWYHLDHRLLLEGMNWARVVISTVYRSMGHLLNLDGKAKARKRKDTLLHMAGETKDMVRILLGVHQH